MLVIFCSNPLRRVQPDPDYAGEYEAASEAGFQTVLLNFEALVDADDAEQAIRGIAPWSAPELALYRGWMLRPAAYARLYETLAARGVRLINSPEAYRVCHYLPESYPYIQEHTPRTAWMPLDGDVDPSAIMRLLASFADAPLILKDYVKSRKHEWRDACFIESAASQDGVMRVVTRFLELQRTDLNEGLVFREYVPLQPLAAHPKSGMPMSREFRRFYLDGAPLVTSAYWDAALDDSAGPPDSLFAEVADRIPSRFFTMDLARTMQDKWIIVELGDGQVAGLPERLSVQVFYRALAASLAPKML